MFAFTFHKNDPGLPGPLEWRKKKQYIAYWVVYFCWGLGRKIYYNHETKSWTQQTAQEVQTSNHRDNLIPKPPDCQPH